MKKFGLSLSSKAISHFCLRVSEEEIDTNKVANLFNVFAEVKSLQNFSILFDETVMTKIDDHLGSVSTGIVKMSQLNNMKLYFAPRVNPQPVGNAELMPILDKGLSASLLALARLPKLTTLELKFPSCWLTVDGLERVGTILSTLSQLECLQFEVKVKNATKLTVAKFFASLALLPKLNELKLKLGLPGASQHGVKLLNMLYTPLQKQLDRILDIEIYDQLPLTANVKIG